MRPGAAVPVGITAGSETQGPKAGTEPSRRASDSAGWCSVRLKSAARRQLHGGPEYCSGTRMRPARPRASGRNAGRDGHKPESVGEGERCAVRIAISGGAAPAVPIPNQPKRLQHTLWKKKQVRWNRSMPGCFTARVRRAGSESDRPAGPRIPAAPPPALVAAALPACAPTRGRPAALRRAARCRGGRRSRACAESRRAGIAAV